MNTVTILSASIVIAVAIILFAFLPATVTLNVGDAGSRVNEIGRYGYMKSIFSLRSMNDGNGAPLEPSAYLIGPNGYHLLIWHNDRIDSMSHFRHEQPVPNTYGKWTHEKQVDTFTVNRPSSLPFFAGVAMLGVLGFLLARFRRTSPISLAILILFVALMVFGFSALAGTFAIVPMLFGVGWIFSWIFGRSLNQTQKPTAELA